MFIMKILFSSGSSAEAGTALSREGPRCRRADGVVARIFNDSLSVLLIITFELKFTEPRSLPYESRSSIPN